MKCPKCNRPVSLKKNTLVDCRCGARLLTTQIKGKLEIFDLRKDGR
jgi:DNA-directed RNA polymerase subunit RPC12/RpoP